MRTPISAVDFVITVKGAEPVWVPIRLDNQRVIAAREGVRDLRLQVQERGEWQVSLAGEGEHRIRVELRAAVGSELRASGSRSRFRRRPRRGSSSTSRGRESDVLIGADEDYGLKDLGPGKGNAAGCSALGRDRSWT